MSTATHRTLGPPAVAWRATAPQVLDDASAQWTIEAPGHLHGPPGYLQGGLCAGLALAVARDVDPHGAPPTSVSLRLQAPTPLQAPLTARAEHVQAGEHGVTVHSGDTLLGEAEVALTGHELVPQVGDLQELSDVVLPNPQPQSAFPMCWVCGAGNPDGLHLLPGWHDDRRIVTPWIPDDAHIGPDGYVDPVMVCAVLDCPTVWASWKPIEAAGHVAALLAGYRVTFYVDVPVGEPLRTVAIHDDMQGRKVHARSALIDEDGIVYATTSALWIGIDELLTPPVDASG